MNELKAKVIAKHQEVVALARKLFPSYANAPMPTVEFYDAGRSAGKCWGFTRIAYNTHVFSQRVDRENDDTIIHEIAHAVANYTRLGSGHNAGWKRICRALGGNGERCYQSQTIDIKAARNRKRYEYRATCGTVVMLSDVRHNAIVRKGKSYKLATTGGLIGTQCFTGKVV